MSRGVAVFGPSGFDEPDNLRELMHRQHGVLDQWLADRGDEVGHDRDGLARVDAVLAEGSDVPEIAHRLGNEVGTFLGCVLVTAVPGAEWAVWPNGHPVVSVGTDEFDVIELVRGRLDTGAPALPEVLDRAADRA